MLGFGLGLRVKIRVRVKLRVKLRFRVRVRVKFRIRVSLIMCSMFLHHLSSSEHHTIVQDFCMSYPMKRLI